jgi:prepilin-type processing-associated H-X9-DG protein
MTWMVHLLPQLENEAVWREAVAAYAADSNFLNRPPHTLRDLPMRPFSCPADSRVDAPAIFASISEKRSFGLTSYLGVDGIDGVRRDGLLYIDSDHRLRDVLDGTSNTLLVGERPPSANLIFGWWYAGWGMTKDGEGDSVLGARTFCRNRLDCGGCGEDPYHFQSARVAEGCAFLHFWSTHPGGANFLFADGAVRFLSYSADVILPALATRAGGEIVPSFN